MYSFIPVIFALLHVMPAFATDSFTLRWAVAHEPTNTRVLDATKDFAARLEKESGGRIKVEIKHYPDGTPNVFAVAKGELRQGKVEMSQLAIQTLREDSGALGVLAVPYLFKDHAHVERVLDGEIGDELRGKFFLDTKRQLRSLAFTYSGGFRHLISNRTLLKPANAKGLKTWRAGTVEDRALLAGVGASLVSCEGCEQKKALAAKMAAGMIELDVGHMNRLATILGMIPAEVRKKFVITETNHSVYLTSIVVNEHFFQRLPDDLRAVLLRNVKAMADSERAISIEQAELNKEFLRSQGVTIAAPSDLLVARFKKTALALQKKSKEFPKSLVRRIEATSNKAGLQANR